MAHPADSSQAANCDQIPIIDLSNINSPQIEERQKLARSVYDACTQVGFFYIQVCGLQVRPRVITTHTLVFVVDQNHGIPEDMINDIHRAAERFFSLPEDQKMKVYIGNSKVSRLFVLTPWAQELNCCLEIPRV